MRARGSYSFDSLSMTVFGQEKVNQLLTGQRGQHGVSQITLRNEKQHFLHNFLKGRKGAFKTINRPATTL